MENDRFILIDKLNQYLSDDTIGLENQNIRHTSKFNFLEDYDAFEIRFVHVSNIGLVCDIYIYDEKIEWTVFPLTSLNIETLQLLLSIVQSESI